MVLRPLFWVCLEALVSGVAAALVPEAVQGGEVAVTVLSALQRRRGRHRERNDYLGRAMVST
jgi:hypothetical protein